MNSLVTLNGNLLAAMDVETTGRDPAFNEICQLAIVLLDVNLEPFDQFYTNICPQYPNRMSPQALHTHGLTVEILSEAPDKFTVADSLWDWYRSLELSPEKGLVPLCHNTPFDVAFMQQMLGYELYYDIFKFPVRDTQAIVAGMMDKAAYNGTKIPINYANLGTCCEALGVQLDDAHDALADALATARVYKALMEKGVW